MRRQHWVTWMLAACVCLMTAHAASAQSGTATLQGKVIDAQKMALPGANVTLANPATGFSRTVQSDASGTFAFPSVPPGTYAMTVEGFEPSARIGRKAFDGLREAEAAVWATECPLAALQFRQHARRIALHPMSILARAYRDDGFPERAASPPAGADEAPA